MTLMAQGFEISFLVGAAVGKRKPVMDFGRLGIAMFLQTLLTQRVGVNEAVPDTFPGASIFPLGISISVILLVVSVIELLVFLAEP